MATIVPPIQPRDDDLIGGIARRHQNGGLHVKPISLECDPFRLVRPHPLL